MFDFIPDLNCDDLQEHHEEHHHAEYRPSDELLGGSGDGGDQWWLIMAWLPWLNRRTERQPPKAPSGTIDWRWLVVIAVLIPIMHPAVLGPLVGLILVFFGAVIWLVTTD